VLKSICCCCNGEDKEYLYKLSNCLEELQWNENKTDTNKQSAIQAFYYTKKMYVF